MILRHRAFGTLILLLCVGLSLIGISRSAAQSTHTLYLPITLYQPPAITPFGFETSSGSITRSSVFTQAENLGATWIRLNTVSWRAVQPTPDPVYDWGKLATFEQELRAAAEANLIPIVIVDDHPQWATVHPSSCSAIRADRFSDFAAFMEQLVTRYKAPPFNVRYWELGNEVDIDPQLLNYANSIYGCWGDIDDPYYGGEHYGNMLKVVTPAIRRADPAAKVLNGGLLLASPEVTTAEYGHPEKFFEGMLRAGAAPYFDIVAYHGHSGYNGTQSDYSGLQADGWEQYGGLAKGKPAYLRQVMQAYGVNKPLFFNEVSLGCPEHFSNVCTNPPASFFEAQADHLVRTMIRSLNVDVVGLVWYTLDGPSWRNGGLLDAGQQPRPSFKAYQHLITRVKAASLPPTQIEYGEGIEAYRFSRGSYVVDTLWSVDETQRIVTIPQHKVRRVYNRDGKEVTPQSAGQYSNVEVGFSVVYVERLP